MSLPVVCGLKHEIELLKQNKMCIPRMAVIHPAYTCNQKCGYCFFKDDLNGYTINKQNFKIMIDQLSDLGVQGIAICGGGEALLTPDIAEIFKYIADKNIDIGLLTNGVLFSGDIAETFLKYGTFVRFSLDSVIPETYKKVKGTDDCEKVKQNINNAALINQNKDYQCEISIKVGAHELLTIDEIQAIFNFCKGKRIHSVQLKNLWNQNGSYYNTSLSKVDMFRMIDNYNIRFIKKVGAKKWIHEKCWMSPVQLTLDAYGDFYLCCYYMYRKESHKVGNIFQKPLTELWGSKEHLDKIKEIKIYECGKHDCRIIQYMDIARHQLKVRDWSFV